MAWPEVPTSAWMRAATCGSRRPSAGRRDGPGSRASPGAAAVPGAAIRAAQPGSSWAIPYEAIPGRNVARVQGPWLARWCDNRRMSESSPNPPGNRPGTTHFGFRDVPTGDKQKLVGEVFSSVAGKYDLMNDLMSLGVHRVWKRYFVGTAQVKRGDRVLDLAGGTGDIAALLRDRVGDAGEHRAGRHQRRDAARRPRPHDRSWARSRGFEYVQMNAETLPFPDASFDLVTIAFGLRNVTDKDAALREMQRVLKVGGQARVLEFSEVKADWFKPIYDFHSFKVLPQPGQAVRERRRQLPVPGREHPQASAAGRAEGDDAGGGIRALRLQNLSARHRGDPYRLQGLRPPLSLGASRLSPLPQGGEAGRVSALWEKVLAMKGASDGPRRAAYPADLPHVRGGAKLGRSPVVRGPIMRYSIPSLLPRRRPGRRLFPRCRAARRQRRSKPTAAVTQPTAAADERRALLRRAGQGRHHRPRAGPARSTSTEAARRHRHLHARLERPRPRRSWCSTRAT